MNNTLSAVEPTVFFREGLGKVEVIPLPNRQFRVTFAPQHPECYVPRTTCETSLPPDLIAAFFEASGSRICDTLARHDDPTSVKGVLRRQVLAYVDQADLRGKRLLDFGCGSGASTFSLAEMFPETEVVGVELNAGDVELAQRVLAARNLPNVSFLVSPDPNSLPPGIGTFDFVMLSAVYEHLLPQERPRVMPLIWSKLKDGGILFINQTPYRYFPLEHHTTGLWFINYLPDRPSGFLARKRSRINRELNRSRDWSGLLRGGIRGGTEGQILSNLRLSHDSYPAVIQPKDQDRAKYWLSRTSPNRHRLIKRFIAALFRISDRILGTVPSMNLDVAIRKHALAAPGGQPG